MLVMEDLFQIFFLVFTFIPYVVVVVCPHVRWLALVAGVLFVIFGIGYVFAPEAQSYLPPNDRTVLYHLKGTFTRPLLLGHILFVATGVVVRLLTLGLRSRGWERWKIIAVSIAGAFAAIAVNIMVDQVKLAISTRAEARVKACRQAVYTVSIGAGRIYLPADSDVSVFRGTAPNVLHQWMEYPDSLKSICDETNLGEQSIDAFQIRMRFANNLGFRIHQYCDEPDRREGWCKVSARLRETMPQMRLPTVVNIFDPSRASHETVGGTVSTYAEARASSSTGRLTQVPGYFVGDEATSGQPPFAALCFKSVDGRASCETAYPWLNDLSIHMSFVADPERIEDDWRVYDQSVRALLDALTTETSAGVRGGRADTVDQ